MRCYHLLTYDKLNKHITEADKQANELFLLIISQLANREKVTEKLKATESIVWVRKMSSARNQVTEIIKAEVIFV